jgi:hypothetical protein
MLTPKPDMMSYQATAAQQPSQVLLQSLTPLFQSQQYVFPSRLQDLMLGILLTPEEICQGACNRMLGTPSCSWCSWCLFIF